VQESAKGCRLALDNAMNAGKIRTIVTFSDSLTFEICILKKVVDQGGHGELLN
jgi:hypothetical protein